MEEILPQTELSEIFFMGADLEVEEAEEPEVAIYLAGPDISTTLAFTADEWRKFASAISGIDEQLPF